MASESPASVRVVLILTADRLYAEVLRQAATQTFPRALIKIATSVEHAGLVLAAEVVDLFITGIGAPQEDDVLDLLLRSAADHHRRQCVLVVTAAHDYRELTALRTLAVHGVFDSAHEAPDALPAALRLIAGGSRYWSPTILEHLQRVTGTSTALFRLLTRFEEMVLTVIGDGSDDSVAAAELGLSPSTVSTVRRELHRKLGVQHRGELVRVAAQHGFVRFTPAGVVRPGFALLSAAYLAKKPKRPAAIERALPAMCPAH
jgi:DNA-binding NarL/FixJ family response regulator